MIDLTRIVLNEKNKHVKTIQVMFYEDNKDNSLNK